MRIGIDVGGTNTDAVLMDDTGVLAGTKHVTTAEVTEGMIAAINELRGIRAFENQEITAVMIGTTHFINALVQARDLAPTAALRLGLPATRGLPPMVDWPQTLTDAIDGRAYLAHGGVEFDGRAISPLDEAELRAHARDMRQHGVKSVAISSVFSPVNADAEIEAGRILADELGPDVALSLSHEVGRVGLLERENATIINAALRVLAEKTIAGVAKAVRDEGITAPIYLSQNDGTLMDEDFVKRYPVATFASGPTNSMRGAARTSGLDHCAVVDVGGTTSDIGIIVNGYPREASERVKVAGIRTNFRMPDVVSLGIGGGSIVDEETAEVGPESVGRKLTEEALVFGGKVLTATDIAVAAGRMDVGDRSRVAHLDAAFVARVMDRIAERVSEAIDRMRTSPESLPVVVVGGGSPLIPDELPLFDDVSRPANHSVANAIGAAVAQIGGEVDRIYAISPSEREQTLAAAKVEARDKAVAAGADPHTVQTIDIEEVPLPYLPGGATRIRVKAVGDLGLDK